jgi:hypothetical protein
VNQNTFLQQGDMARRGDLPERRRDRKPEARDTNSGMAQLLPVC